MADGTISILPGPGIFGAGVSILLLSGGATYSSLFPFPTRCPRAEEDGLRLAPSGNFLWI